MLTALAKRMGVRRLVGNAAEVGWGNAKGHTDWQGRDPHQPTPVPTRTRQDAGDGRRMELTAGAEFQQRLETARTQPAG
jgi:hypothetical protein